MIVVKGEIQLLPPAGLTVFEAELFLVKQARPVTYYYGSEEELRFELRTRRLLTEAAVALNESGAQFTGFIDSKCNPRVWKRDERGGFVLLPYISPADGIRNIFMEGRLYAFECATALVIVLYKGMLDSMGEALFNKWFGNMVLYDWHYDKDLFLVLSKNLSEALAGDVQYFANPDVSPAFPDWRGENVLKLGENLFYGHGIGVKPAELIIASLNTKRKPFSRVSAYMTDTVVYPDYPVVYRKLILGEGEGGYVSNHGLGYGGRSRDFSAAEQGIHARIGFRTYMV